MTLARIGIIYCSLKIKKLKITMYYQGVDVL
jgi:hypothetical protein